MKTGIMATEESVGAMPPQGAKLVIKAIERSKVAADSQFGTPGALQYIATFTVVEPKKYAGTELRKYFEIGTADDPRGKNEETWQRPGGPSHLKRLLVRSATPITDDDDEVWMEAAAGQTVCVHTTVNARGFANIKGGEFFRETDEDFVGIGVKIATDGAAAGAKKPAPKKPVVDDDEDEAPAPKKAPAKKKPVEDDED